MRIVADANVIVSAFLWGGTPLAAYLEREQRNIAMIREGLARARRGEFATDEEVMAFLARHGKPGS